MIQGLVGTSGRTLSSLPVNAMTNTAATIATPSSNVQLPPSNAFESSALALARIGAAAGNGAAAALAIVGAAANAIAAINETARFLAIANIPFVVLISVNANFLARQVNRKQRRISRA